MRCGLARLGEVRFGRQGAVRLGTAGSGVAGRARYGVAGSGLAGEVIIREVLFKTHGGKGEVLT